MPSLFAFPYLQMQVRATEHQATWNKKKQDKKVATARPMEVDLVLQNMKKKPNIMQN